MNRTADSRRAGTVVMLGLAAVMIGGALPACIGIGYTGAARPLDPARLETEPGWSTVARMRALRQDTLSDCGAAAMAMVAFHYGVEVSPADVSDDVGPTARGRRGIRLSALRSWAWNRGLRAFAIHASFRDLAHEVDRNRPIIIGLVQPHGHHLASHYEVVVGVQRDRKEVATIDPASGWRLRSASELDREWKPAGRPALVVLPPSDSDVGKPVQAGAPRASRPAADHVAAMTAPAAGGDTGANAPGRMPFLARTGNR